MSQFGSPTKNPPWVRTSATGQQQGTPTTPNSASMIPSNLINQISFHQGQQQSQQGYQPPGLGVQQQPQPTGLLAHQMQMDKNKGYVTMSFPFQSTGSGQVGRPASVQSATTASQIPGAITYPSPRAIQQAANYATPPTAIAGVVAPSTDNSSLQPKRRVFTGTITKLLENFGFVDDDIFFQINVCTKGLPPKVGERCLVDANYNSSMPFKWNASRVEVLPPEMSLPSQSFSSSGPCYNAVPPPAAFSSGETVFVPGHERERDTERLHERRVRDRRRSSRERERDQDRDRRREERLREREREREKEKEKRSHSPLSRRRSRSPRLKTSRSPPPRRRTRIVPKYMVQVPKISLNMADGNVMELKRRYNNLYIPSDYFCATFRWVDTFPADKPIKLNKPCSFHILPKSVTAITENTAVLEPSDADYTFSAKVMPLSLPGMAEMISKTCPLAEEVRHEKDSRGGFVHPTRLINFLVGVRGKNETMAIGGPWSPSLDGPNPDKDPAVLIRTAIRTCKALTGLDLSPCTSWYRFLDIHYYRGESNHKGKVIPSRVETVVIFLPDVWGCMPTRLEWDEVHVTFEEHYKVDETSEGVNTECPSTSASENSTCTLSSTTSAPDPSLVAEESEADKKVTPVIDSIKKEKKEVVTADLKKAEAVTVKSEEEEKLEPTHYSKLDLKTMKVVDIRRELEARALNAKGLKSQMVARLAKVLKTEKELELERCLLLTDSDEAEEKAEEAKVSQEADLSTSSGAAPEVSESMELDPTPDKEIKVEKDAVAAVDLNLPANVSKKMLPENPHILVYPSRTAKSGKFDCTVMSLSLLLDYRSEDTKEHSFEVSLFAELFNEMLMRDNGFRIYRALMNAPEKNKESQSTKSTEIESKQGKETDSSKEAAEASSTEQENVVKVEEIKEEPQEGNSAIKMEVSEETPVEEMETTKASEQIKEEVLELDEEDDESREGSASNASSKKPDSDKTKDASKEKDGKERKIDKKMLSTTDPALLMAFLYFDQTHCGYIFDKDLEEILYMLGLNLSRAQVRKLLQKVVTRDTLNYRKLTDAPCEDEASQSGCVASEVDLQSELSLLASGNRVLFPTPMPTHPPDPEAQTKVEGVTKSGLVIYEDEALELAKLTSSLETSEKERITTENVMTHFSSRLRDVNIIAHHQAKKLEDLSSNLKDCTNKLNITEEGLSEAEKGCAHFLQGIDCLSDIVDKTLSKAAK